MKVAAMVAGVVWLWVGELTCGAGDGALRIEGDVRDLSGQLVAAYEVGLDHSGRGELPSLGFLSPHIQYRRERAGEVLFEGGAPAAGRYRAYVKAKGFWVAEVEVTVSRGNLLRLGAVRLVPCRYRGIQVKGADGGPIREANVILRGRAGRVGEQVLGTTGAEGGFEWVPIPREGTELWIEAVGWASTPLDLAGSTQGWIRPTLTRGVSLQIEVTSGGGPLVGKRVVSRDASALGRPRGVTDEDGVLVLEHLLPGTQNLAVLLDEHGTHRLEFECEALAGGLQYHIALGEARQIHGRVLVFGQPVSAGDYVLVGRTLIAGLSVEERRGGSVDQQGAFSAGFFTEGSIDVICVAGEATESTVSQRRRRKRIDGAAPFVIELSGQGDLSVRVDSDLPKQEPVASTLVLILEGRVDTSRRLGSLVDEAVLVYRAQERVEGVSLDRVVDLGREYTVLVTLGGAKGFASGRNYVTVERAEGGAVEVVVDAILRHPGRR